MMELRGNNGAKKRGEESAKHGRMVIYIQVKVE
jgi:hypothetical protein